MSTKNVNNTLRRTAREVKRYRLIMRVVPIAMGCAVLALTVLYAFTALYGQYGAFTVSVNKFDNVKYALSLSETPQFYEPVSKLNSKASEEITNIDGATLPGDIDMINGEHNGRNYVAYTFYCKNAGEETVTYEYRLFISNMTYDIEKAVRIRLYVDGTPTTYARTSSDGTGPEPNTVEFESESLIARGQISGFEPEELTKYTVVIWLEGNDPDCVDSILGGEFKVDMSMSIIGIEDEE